MRRIAIACALFAMIWLCPGLASALPEMTWVVALGNNHGNAGEEALLYAERDAREFSDVLRTHGGVASERVRLLVDEDASAARRAILEASNAARAQVTAGASTALVIFYSGHADATGLHLKGTNLPLDELRATVQSSAASLRVLVIDACRSGTVTRVKGVTPSESFAIKLDDRVEAEGMAIVSSSAAGEASQEADRLRGSFFSHHLVNALRGAADRNGDGRVTLNEAYAYTYAQTVRSSGETQTMQHPTYAYDVRGRNDVVMTSPGAAGRRSGRLRLAQAGLYVVFEDHDGGPIFAEVSPPRDGAVLAMPAGRYFVQQRSSSEYREFTVKLDADADADLASQPSRVVKYDLLVRKRGADVSHVHGLTLLGAARGRLLPGEGPMPSLVLGYSADLSALSIGARVRGATVRLESSDGALPSQRYELGLGGVVQHYVDFRSFSVAFGATFEGIYATQTFQNAARQTNDRRTAGLAFGALVAAEKRVYEGVSLRLEAGPTAMIFPQASVQDGRESASDRTSTVTWWFAGGVAWRL